MELTRVEVTNWPQDRGPGGQVAPAGSLFWWDVTRVHAWYEAPPVFVDEYDPVLREVARVGKRLFPLTAYLVDLDGSHWKFGGFAEELGSFERVLLHQRPGPRWWWLRDVSAEKLTLLEQFRKA